MPDATNTMPALEFLTVANARAALEQGVAAIRAGQTLFDLGAVKTVDSAAVSVLLAWQRAARDAGKTLHFSALPDSLASLATLYGVDAFLPAPEHHGASAPAELRPH